MQLRRALDAELDEIAELDLRLVGVHYPFDALPDDTWVIQDRGEIVAYAASKPSELLPGYVYLSRCGVIESHRGRGLQRRLIRARLRAARRDGLIGAYTYTVLDNPPSANSLISEGFRLFDPGEGWRRDVLWWRKAL